MSIHVALSHVTSYVYDRQVALAPQVVRLRPAPHCRTPILSYSMRVEPAEHFFNWQQDPFANYLGRLVFPEKTSLFRVTVDLVAQMAVYNPFDFFLEESAEKFPFAYETGLHHDLLPYLAKEPSTPRFGEFVASIDRREQRTIDFLVNLNQRLQSEIRADQPGTAHRRGAQRPGLRTRSCSTASSPIAPVISAGSMPRP